jgi:hypothetical protein
MSSNLNNNDAPASPASPSNNAPIDRDLISQEKATKAVCKVRMNEHVQSIVEALQAYYKGGCGIEYVHDRVLALKEAISAL